MDFISFKIYAEKPALRKKVNSKMQIQYKLYKQNLGFY